MGDLMWQPSSERIAAANLTAFIKTVEDQGVQVSDFPRLYQWSIEFPDAFWLAVWRFCEVRASQSWDSVFERTNQPVPLAGKWFAGARLNFAENLLRYRDEQPALVFRSERNGRRSLTYAELFDRVAQTAAALRERGVTTGDRVAGFMPNVPETVIAMLAAASIGAVWSSTSPDFGLQGVLDRFGQIEPKILFAADGYWYGGKPFDTLSRVAQIVARIPSIQTVVVTEYLHRQSLAGIPSAVRFDEFVRKTNKKNLPFAQLPFDHPLYILYSSGTTGVPKCIVHSAGGTLIQHLKELVLHTDLRRSDRIFYFTTCGWMMWNWLVSSLAVGATIVLYDGSPMSPPARLWDVADEERLTVFGTSARYLAGVEKAGLKPAQTHGLADLRTILSTGSPLAPKSFDFVYDHVKPDVCLSSISGGTDIVSCFALGNPIGPVYRGELQTRGLGMNVQVFNETAQPVRGVPSELVCTAPFPSMPICFWNDPNGQGYREAYFDYFPDVWRHGDWVELTEHDGMIFYGRSDTVLNPGGVRIGTAEIYRQVEQLDEVLESVVVGQDWKGDTRVVLFVKLRGELLLDDALTERIKQQIRDNTTPRHVPKKIIQVADIPRTISGKVVELAVRDVIHGRAVKNKEALANPEALELFKNLSELS
jgi:acetoacetyl-CoA synthetase